MIATAHQKTQSCNQGFVNGNPLAGRGDSPTVAGTCRGPFAVTAGRVGAAGLTSRGAGAVDVDHDCPPHHRSSSDLSGSRYQPGIGSTVASKRVAAHRSLGQQCSDGARPRSAAPRWLSRASTFLHGLIPRRQRPDAGLAATRHRPPTDKGYPNGLSAVHRSLVAEVDLESALADFPTVEKVAASNFGPARLKPGGPNAWRRGRRRASRRAT
jgi:hypothetical protein